MSDAAEPSLPKAGREQPDLLSKLADRLRLEDKNTRTISLSTTCPSHFKVAHDVGANRTLLPMASVGDIPTIPGELFAKFQTSFYSDPRDAAFKALGVE